MLLALLAGLGIASAQDAPLRAPIIADGPVSSAEFKGEIDYYLDPDWTKTPADMAGPDADLFQPVERSQPDFGYIKDKVWLRVRVTNATEDITQWRFHTRENFKQVSDVYVVREDGRIDHAMDLNQDSPFSDRSVKYPEMVAPVNFEPGETITIFFTFWSEGSSNSVFSLETLDSFSEMSVRRMAKNFTYYGMMFVLIFAALVGWAIQRHPVFLAYIAYAVSVVLYLAHGDGVAFQYLWPNNPGFNSLASVFIGGAVIMSCAAYAQVYLQTRTYHPRIDVILKSIIGLTLFLFVIVFVVDPQPIKQGMIFLAGLTVFLCVIAGVLAARKRFDDVRFYIIAWAGAAVAVMIMNLRHIFHADIAQDLEFDAMRVAMVFDAVLLGLAIADRYRQLRKSRQQALQQSLENAERNLRLNSRLNELEQQFELATDLSRSRDAQMQNTVHDLRQPLHALRLNVKTLINKGAASEDDSEHINQTFEYLETLIASQLRQSIDPTQMSEATSPPAASACDCAEDQGLGTQQVLATIHEMFLPDAQDKGLDFRFVPSRLEADINPFILMRIVTNLVSNAIKYTDEGKILLGTRRAGNDLRIEIHDTGPGLSPDDFKAALERHVRLPVKGPEKTSRPKEGMGYGLAIVQELVDAHEIDLVLLTSRAAGTGIGVRVPRK